MTVVIAAPYRTPQAPAVPYPRFGVGILAGSPTNADYLALLNNTMTESISGSNFSMNDGGVGAGNYMYFASPFDHGNVSFVDTANDIQGGWDGATWPTDGTIAETSGYVSVTLTVGADTREWYLYRTDFKDIGQKTWKMLFDVAPTSLKLNTDPDPGIGYGDITTAVANFIPLTVNGPAYTANMQNSKYLAFRYVPNVGEDHLHSAFGLGDSRLTLLDGNSSTLLGWQDLNNGTNGLDESNISYSSSGPYVFLVVHNQTTGEGSIDFDVSTTSAAVVIPGSGYASEILALASPVPASVNSLYSLEVSQGNYLAFEFESIDTRSHIVDVLAVAGGPQDASYSIYQDSVLIYGPIDANNGPGGADEIDNGTVITHLTTGPEQDKGKAVVVVHNINTSGGTDNFTIRVDVDLTPPFPLIGVGVLSEGFTGSELVAITQFTESPANNQTITLTTTGSNYMYFASPVVNGEVIHIDTANNYVGGWDGATWPIASGVGTENGPRIMSLDVNGDIRDWYVYRSDFPALGTKTYRLTYGNLEGAMA